MKQPHQSSTNPKVLYRYITYNSNESCNTSIGLNEFQIIKETPKGYWIWTGFGRYENYLPSEYVTDSDAQKYVKEQLNIGLKWVSNDCRKRFAYPTKEEAQINFKFRKERQIKILKSQLSRAEYALRAINILIDPVMANNVNSIRIESV